MGITKKEKKQSLDLKDKQFYRQNLFEMFTPFQHAHEVQVLDSLAQTQVIQPQPIQSVVDSDSDFLTDVNLLLKCDNTLIHDKSSKLTF